MLQHFLGYWVTSRSVWSFQTSSRSVIREICNQENKFWKCVCFPQHKDQIRYD